MTQSELAEHTQTTKSYISKIENGVITPPYWCILSYHCYPRNEGGSGKSDGLSIKYIYHIFISLKSSSTALFFNFHFQIFYTVLTSKSINSLTTSSNFSINTIVILNSFSV